MAFYRRVLAIAVLGSASVLSSSMLSGCGSFFSCEGKASCGGTTTPVTNSGDYVYVSDSPSGNTYLSEYSLTSGTLAPISGASEINLGFVPIAMVVAPSNGYLYVASRADAASAGIYVYTISSTGGLTVANSGNPIYIDSGIISMDISPDGTFLYAVSSTGLTGVVVNQFQLNTSTGLPTVSTPTPFPTLYTSATNVAACSLPNSGSPLSQLCTVKVSPNANFVAVALAGYGTEVFPFTATGGITSSISQLAPTLNELSGDFSLAFDKNGYIYVSSTSALTSYGSLSSTAAPALVQEVDYTTLTPIPVTPRSVTVSSNSEYVYTANEGSGTISGFSLPGSGKLTSPGTSTVGPTSVSALGVDSTGAYLVAAGFNATNGLQVFSIGTTGALTLTGTSVATGTYDSTNAVPIVMALSH